MSHPLENTDDAIRQNNKTDPRFLEMAQKMIFDFFGHDYVGLRLIIAQALSSLASPKPTPEELRRLVREIRDTEFDSWHDLGFILSEEEAMKLLEDLYNEQLTKKRLTQ